MRRHVLRSRRVARVPLLLRVLPFWRVTRRAVFLDLWVMVTAFLYWVHLMGMMDEWWIGPSFVLVCIIVVFAITDEM